jgi:hypothetical protein
MNNDNVIVVLNDGETYSSEQGCYVYFLSPEGLDQLDMDNEPDEIDEQNILKKVSISDLIECWLRNTQNR